MKFIKAFKAAMDKLKLDSLEKRNQKLMRKKQAVRNKQLKTQSKYETLVEKVNADSIS